MSGPPDDTGEGNESEPTGPRKAVSSYPPLRVPIDEVPRRSAVSDFPPPPVDASEASEGAFEADLASVAILDADPLTDGAEAVAHDEDVDDPEVVIDEGISELDEFSEAEEPDIEVADDTDAEQEIEVAEEEEPGDPEAEAPAIAASDQIPESASAEAEGDALDAAADRESEPPPFPHEGAEAAASQTPVDPEEIDLEGAEIVDDEDFSERPSRDHTPPPMPPPDAKAELDTKAEAQGGKADAPSPPPAREEGKKPEAAKPTRRKRPWYEDFFSDDYLRTVRTPIAREVARECDFIEKTLGLAPGSTILDIGCGLGLHSVELTARGYLVVGLDLSLPMLSRAADEAQDRGLRINFLHGDMREMTFEGAFDGVLCWGTSFGYFDDEANRRVVQRLHDALRPGGRLLLDTVNRDYVVRSQPNLVWFEGDGCICMEETGFNYITSRLEVSRNVILDDGRQRDKHYSIRLYSLHEIGLILHQSNFRVIEVSGFHATPGVYFGADSPRMTILAERRSEDDAALGGKGRASTPSPPGGKSRASTPSPPGDADPSPEGSSE